MAQGQSLSRAALVIKRQNRMSGTKLVRMGFGRTPSAAHTGLLNHPKAFNLLDRDAATVEGLEAAQRLFDVLVAHPGTCAQRGRELCQRRAPLLRPGAGMVEEGGVQPTGVHVGLHLQFVAAADAHVRLPAAHQGAAFVLMRVRTLDHHRHDRGG